MKAIGEEAGWKSPELEVKILTAPVITTRLDWVLLGKRSNISLDCQTHINSTAERKLGLFISIYIFRGFYWNSHTWSVWKQWMRHPPYLTGHTTLRAFAAKHFDWELPFCCRNVKCIILILRHMLKTIKLFSHSTLTTLLPLKRN